MWLVGQDLRANGPPLLSVRPFLPFIYFRFRQDLHAPAFTLFCLHLSEAYFETVITGLRGIKRKKLKCLTEETAVVEAGFGAQEVNGGRQTNLKSAEQRTGQEERNGKTFESGHKVELTDSKH